MPNDASRAPSHRLPAGPPAAPTRRSPHTIASYADSFVLLLRFAAARVKREPADLQVEDLDVGLVRAFLNHLESDRGNGARSRNIRFSAIRSFFRYIEYRAPACLQQAMSIRALPIKRADTRLIDYLSRDEMKALLDAPNPHAVGGLRDRAMLHLAYAAGLRVSELLSLRLEDFPDRSLKTVRVIGKGRRERVLPRGARHKQRCAHGSPSDRPAKGRSCSSTATAGR